MLNILNLKLPNGNYYLPGLGNYRLCDREL